MRSIFLLITGVLVVATITGRSMSHAAEPSPEEVKRDRQRIAGTWKLTDVVVNGNPMPAKERQKLEVINRPDGTWELHSGGAPIAKGTSTLDPTRKPKTIDFEITEGGGKENRYLGIYQLENNDRRKMCFSSADYNRPTQFTSTPGNQTILLAFRRSDSEGS